MNSKRSIYPRLRHAISAEQHDFLPRLPYRHDDLYEVILISSGTARFISDDKQYQVQAGDALFCLPETCYALFPDDAGLCYTSLLFELPEYLRMSGLPPEDVIRCGDGMERFLPLIQMLLSDGTLPTVQSHLLSALLLQIRTYSPLSCTQQIPEDSAAYAMARFIDAHYTKDIFLSDIAESVHLTTSHAIHVFKPIFEISPMQFLSSRRIGQAQHLLLTTELSANRIASEVGISNVNYFYTVFKKLVGLSPVSYRTNFQNRTAHYPIDSD